MTNARLSRIRLAGAVGAVAGGLGAGQAADAVVVFENFVPPKHVHPEEVFIDLGGDSVNEFRLGASIDGVFVVTGIKADTFAGTDILDMEGNVIGVRPGMAGVLLDALNYATNLAPGTLIGPTDVYVSPVLTRLNGDTNSIDFEPAGNFNDVSGFVGIQFELNGNTHYGYMGYEGESGLGAPGEVFKIGYEDTPGLGILTGSEESIAANQGVPGDFNGNNSVDAADYVVWREKVGNQQSYNVWRSNFGNTAGGGEAARLSLSAGSVPEPTSLALLAAGAAGVSLYRRRRTAKDEGGSAT